MHDATVREEATCGEAAREQANFPKMSGAPLAFALDIRHVLIDESGIQTAQANGVTQCALQLAREQAQMGDAVRLVVVTPDGSTEIADEALRIDAHAARGLRAGGKLLSIGRAALDALVRDAGALTVYHVHGARTPAFLFLAGHLISRKLPFVVTLHGQYSHIPGRGRWPASPLSHAYVALLESAALRRARFVQALSPVERDIIRHLAGGAAIREIGNGVYSSSTGQPPRPERRAPGKDPVFGFLSRFATHHKGMDLLIDGFALYRRAGGTGRLELVGSGDLDPALLSQIAAEGFDSLVTIHGRRIGPEKAAVTDRWHYFVLPSRFEGQPLAALEAALAGLPVIVTRDTGLAPIVEAGGGILIQDTTSQAVADALMKAEILSRDHYERASDLARAWSLRHADWSRVAGLLRAGYLPP